MTDEAVERALRLPILSGIDQSRFPARLALADIIRNDSRVERYRRGQLIVREGDYGNAAFFVISGSVGVVLEHAVALEARGRRTRHRSWLSAVSQLWSNARTPERREVSDYLSAARIAPGADRGAALRPLVPHFDAFVHDHQMVELGEGETFGEIAAMSRTPRRNSVVALTDCELLEIRWQGLRDIRRHDKAFREQIDQLYRARSLKSHLSETGLFGHLDDAAISAIAAATQFETYGEFEWFSAFRHHLDSEDASRVIEREPVIATQGDYVDGLLLIGSGFARISERVGHGDRTVRYATHGDEFGLEEIRDHFLHQRPLTLRHSLHAVGYVDVLRVPTALVERYVLPQIAPPPEERPRLLRRYGQGEASPLEPALVNFLVDRRVINGTATMLINMDRCVECDDCVNACAAAHDGNPRFVRHGLSFDKLMVANACMHCKDPVCLIDCPTGAIHRLPEDGRVIIDDVTCIGCGTCANSCPYDNIRLVDIRDDKGAFILDEVTGAPIVKATKCDLCVDQLGGPACQRACPHDALARVDMGDQEKLAAWVNR